MCAYASGWQRAGAVRILFPLTFRCAAPRGGWCSSGIPARARRSPCRRSRASSVLTAAIFRWATGLLYASDKGVDIPARQRHLGYVFQDYALFPHLTVRGNVEFGLGRERRTFLGRPTPEARRDVERLLERFEVGHLAGTLSPGDFRRPAAARGAGLVSRWPSPACCFSTSPSRLDPLLRVRMRREIRDLLDEWDIPLVLITH